MQARDRAPLSRRLIAASALSLLWAQAVNAGVLINEIHYNPDVKTELVEFIELYNSGTNAVNVSGWQLADAVSYTIPNNTELGAGQFLVIAQDPPSLKTKFGATAVGPWTGILSNDGEKITLKNAAGGVEHQVTYQCGFPWPTVGDIPGYSVQLVNPAFDTDLGGNWRSAPPTPRKVNSVFATNLPPQIRQVDHSPNQPKSGQTVTITAKISDPEGVKNVQLQYQVVTPGNYIEMADSAYVQNWSTVAMNDGGTNGDATKGDSIYTAVLPASIQNHRTLVRYRITATDNTGLSITVPYADDPQPNFAYFCYDGVPAWTGAVNPGATPAVTFDTNVMRRLPVIHLIAKKTSVEDATWLNQYGGSLYLWSGTIVFDGKVYDHVHYRARGGCWRYSMVKNMWKVDFNRGHDLEMNDDYGNKYSTTWKKLNLGSCIQQGDYGHRGEQGMFESVGFRLFNLAGVAACRTTFLQFRVIDDSMEADPASQYEGDFWGLYLGVEQPDGHYLDQHGMPDGNLYKMEGYSGSLNNIGLHGPTDGSDLAAFLRTGSADSWWQANFDLNAYYSYRTIVEGMHHYDIGDGKNYFYYRDPVTGLWSVHPWDLDLTWADNMYGSGNEPFKSQVLTRPAFNLDYQNRIREIRDLLFNSDQGNALIEEMAGLLRGSGTGPTFLDADRAMWDYNPKMDSYGIPSKAGRGVYYRWPYENGASTNFAGCLEVMKNYIVTRGKVLDALANDTSVPSQPTISYTGPAGYPLNKLTFHSGAYYGKNPFAAMKWRLGETAAVGDPAYDPSHARHYEITPVWESQEMTNFTGTFTFPLTNLVAGHTYRARVRMKDNTGRWGRWSLPASFIAGAPDTAGALMSYLRCSELMYNPPAGSDYEFVELHNSSSTVTLNLAGAAFTDGITYTFPSGITIAPNGYLLVIRNASAADFRSYYGLATNVPVAGPYTGNLANGGEQLTLKTSAGGTNIFSFTFGNGRGWPLAASGAGHSLVPVNPDAGGQATGALDYPGNWRASTYINGSPGRADLVPPPPSILINEFAANTDVLPGLTNYDSNDWIELYNTTASSITISGWYLTDDPAALNKWAIPTTTIPAHSYVSFDEITGFHKTTNGFGLDKTGEQILLSRLVSDAMPRVVDEVSFKGQDYGVSLGRIPDGAPYWMPSSPTRERANVALAPSICIAEIMYHPPDLGTNDNTRDEYVKLFNPTSDPIALQDTNGTWRVAGGIDFTFPTNTVIPAGGTLLVINFAPTNTTTLALFRAAYGFTNLNVPILGPYSGKLGNRGDRVAIERPKSPTPPALSPWWIIVDEAIFGNQSPWSSTADGGGNSLQRVSMTQSANDPANWIAASPNPGSISMDRDGDGIPDAWEISHYLNPNDPTDAMLDSDNDGLTNLQEYLSGTDPRDPSSKLGFDSTEVSSTVVKLRFTAVGGKSYTVLATDNLTDSSWSKMTNMVAAPTTHQMEITVPSNGQMKYYRLVTPAQQ